MGLRYDLHDLIMRMSITYNGAYYYVLTLVRDDDTLTMEEVQIFDEANGTHYYDKFRKLIEHGMLTESDHLEITERGRKIMHYADRIAEESDYTNP